MLIEGCLMRDREAVVKFMQEKHEDAGENILKDMDISTEYVLLSTNSLDYLPRQVQESIREVMKLQLEQFSHFLIGAINYGFAVGKLDEGPRIIKDGLDIIEKRLSEAVRQIPGVHH